MKIYICSSLKRAQLCLEEGADVGVWGPNELGYTYLVFKNSKIDMAMTGIIEGWEGGPPLPSVNGHALLTRRTLEPFSFMDERFAFQRPSTWTVHIDSWSSVRKFVRVDVDKENADTGVQFQVVVNHELLRPTSVIDNMGYELDPKGLICPGVQLFFAKDDPAIAGFVALSGADLTEAMHYIGQRLRENASVVQMPAHIYI